MFKKPGLFQKTSISKSRKNTQNCQNDNSGHFFIYFFLLLESWFESLRPKILEQLGLVNDVIPEAAHRRGDVLHILPLEAQLMLWNIVLDLEGFHVIMLLAEGSGDQSHPQIRRH